MGVALFHADGHDGVSYQVLQLLCEGLWKEAQSLKCHIADCYDPQLFRCCSGCVTYAVEVASYSNQA